jgi:hypothetical protein
MMVYEKTVWIDLGRSKSVFLREVLMDTFSGQQDTDFFGLPEDFDESQTDEESELGESLPVFDPIEDDLEPLQAFDDLLDDPLIWMLMV